MALSLHCKIEYQGPRSVYTRLFSVLGIRGTSYWLNSWSISPLSLYLLYVLSFVTDGPIGLVFINKLLNFVYSRARCLNFDLSLHLYRERSGSVVECLTWDWGAAGSSLTGITALWSLSRHIYPSLVPVQPSRMGVYQSNWRICNTKTSGTDPNDC